MARAQQGEEAPEWLLDAGGWLYDNVEPGSHELSRWLHSLRYEDAWGSAVMRRSTTHTGSSHLGQDRASFRHLPVWARGSASLQNSVSKHLGTSQRGTSWLQQVHVDMLLLPLHPLQVCCHGIIPHLRRSPTPPPSLLSLLFSMAV